MLHFRILLFSSFLSGAIATSSPLFPIHEMKKCDDSSQFEIAKFRDFGGKPFKIQWTPSAGKNCPGEGFPRVVVRNFKVSEYLHLVSTNAGVPDELAVEASWNPLGIKTPWSFVDIGPAERNRKNLFYSSGPEFHDNPKWEGNNLVWLGSVYGFKKTAKETRVPVLGFSWGFTIDNSKIQALKPLALGPRDWLKDYPIVARILVQWKENKTQFEQVIPKN